ncbi:hypothetical protein KY349_02300 [Candidatus Woesearchaeota archaeon]|nr:hypothetical protein [Candidatus Woesearchaeota archaeon]
MIEILIMLAGLVALGYAFNISSRMLWVFKSEKGLWRWLYGMISAFLIATYILFAFVTFYFIMTPSSQSMLSILNIVIGIFFLSGAGLIGAAMKYHLSSTMRAKQKPAPQPVVIKKTKPDTKDFRKERVVLQKEIYRLSKELDESKKLNKLAVGRELKIIELKKKIERLEGIE